MRSVIWLPPVRRAIICISTAALLVVPEHPRASAAGVDLAVPGRANAGVAGAPRFAREVLGNSAVYPVIASAGDAVVAAWTSGKGADSAIHVEVRR
ncbi:MAG TPA: hypothetical protein VKD69_09285 [Vicinamibacterales bacterium]|nr:hypothetical protein [Vicinamibacterales bacterium]